MRPRDLIPIVIALAVPLALLLGFRGEEGLYQLYVPRGYIDEVNRLIAENKLTYDCRTEEIHPQSLTEGEEFFLRYSYLRSDLARWRAGDRTPFVVEREELRGGDCQGALQRVSESYHNQRLPTYRATSWHGRLFVRQGAASVGLSGSHRVLEVARPPWRRLPFPANAFEDVWLDRDADRRGERMALKMFESGRMFASLEHIGDQVAVEIFNQRPEVLLNGCPLPRGWRLRLDDGDRLRFLDPRAIDQRYRVEAGSTAGLISYVNTVNGEIRRKTLSHRLAMATGVTRAIDAAVIRAPDGSRDDFDVHLTLDTFFQDLLDHRLGAFCRTRYGRRPLRAGVTLLAADSGRVLALASYPQTGDLERLALERDNHAELLARNHNFLQHPVGSATKPFLAAAALAIQPRLGTLALPCFVGGEPPADFLGFDFGTYNLPADCIGGDGAITFRRFLEVSSNRYMLALGLLALADWQDGGPTIARDAAGLPPRDHYRIGGTTYTRRPQLAIVKDESHPGQTELADVEAPAFFQRFRDLFGHQVHYQAGSFDAGLALEAWQPVLDAAGSAGDAATARAFAAVTAERVNLKVNLIQQLRQDLYTTLLGLGNNRWSNLLLAESMARLVTGKAVRARLVERVETPPDKAAADAGEAAAEVHWDLETARAAAPSPDLDLPPASRRLVLDGMADVVTAAAGTAHADLGAALAALARRAPAGVSYRALAKTGTPSTDRAIVERGPTVPAANAIEVYSGRPQVKDGVLVMAISREQAGTRETLTLALFIEGQGGSEQATALAADLLAPLVEAYWPEDWLSVE